MDIKRTFIPGDGFHVPCVLVTPSNPTGCVVIVHGYGGSKEEQLGLAWRVAETGLAACAIDMRGHGEHMLPFDINAHDDVEAAIRHCRSYGKVIIIGHSLGGRLALLSSADAVIALSPAICPTYGPSIHRIIESWCYKVREPSKASVFEILEKLPVWQPANGRPTAIIHGSRDMPEIRQGCIDLKSKGVRVTEIENALHNDIFLLEPTLRAIKNELALIL
ncbi:MAG TPA: alpha/beta fold hydrolase [Methanocella sp.]|jgi:alpha-beta hydrolase superfamily lysophospholipase